MKKNLVLILAFLLILAWAMPIMAQYGRDTTVQGYTRKDGTYVQPHHRTAPDNSRFNNYSTQGNVNPYTGQMGTVNPYTQPQPQVTPYGQQQRRTWP
ncbi:MAG: hypothetical protein Q7O12_14305 [Deltaproteobacteria bacterium]|nr:hypothetical protein [Deltaproteobacteria bacterium]